MEVIGANIDRACTVELRPGRGNLPRGYIGPLYQAARDQAPGPLTLGLAHSLHERVEEDRPVFITTGAGAPPLLPHGEIDGLLGSAALARAIHQMGGGSDFHPR